VCGYIFKYKLGGRSCSFHFLPFSTYIFQVIVLFFLNCAEIPALSNPFVATAVSQPKEQLSFAPCPLASESKIYFLFLLFPSLSLKGKAQGSNSHN
jgi:hypothetical protein